MRILFDTNTPAPLAQALKKHKVTRTGDLKWQGLEDRDLLDAAEEAGFDLLITCDQNIQYQQNFTGRKLAVLILSTNHWPSMKPMSRQIATAAEFVQRGQFMQIDVETLR